MPRLSKAEKERCHKEILEMEQAKIKPYLDRIADLEKENAELKSGCGMCYRKDKEQLIKAKEIIKKLIEAIHIWDCKNLEEVETEAEQFLKDCEVEK